MRRRLRCCRSRRQDAHLMAAGQCIKHKHNSKKGVAQQPPRVAATLNGHSTWEQGERNRGEVGENRGRNTLRGLNDASTVGFS